MGLLRPPSRQRSDSARIPRKPERAVARESSAVTRARLPPVGGCIDDRVTRGLCVVGAAEIANPRDHGARRETVAFAPARPVWQEFVSSRPNSLISDESTYIRYPKHLGG
jgi:hypothetical protein